MLTDNAGIWYDEYQREINPKNRNTYSFLCLLRNKLISKISKDVLWNQNNRWHHPQLRKPDKPAPVNQYAQKLEEYRMRCLDTDEEKMVSLQAMKMKFMDAVIPQLREKVRPLIDWNMPLDEIVSIAEKIQTTTKLTVPQQLVQKLKQLRQWSQGKPMECQKSNYKLQPNLAAAQLKGAPHPDAKNSINSDHFPNARKDKTK